MRTSDFVSGFDSYNLCLTGNVGRTLATPSGGLNEHIPIVLTTDERNSNESMRIVQTERKLPEVLQTEGGLHPAPETCQPNYQKETKQE